MADKKKPKKAVQGTPKFEDDKNPMGKQADQPTDPTDDRFEL